MGSGLEMRLAASGYAGTGEWLLEEKYLPCEWEKVALGSESLEIPKFNQDSRNPSTLVINFRVAVGQLFIAKPGTVSHISPACSQLLLPGVLLQHHGKSLMYWPEPTVTRILNSKVSSGRTRQEK